MNTKTTDRLLLFSIFFLALWFFGNLYEEILIAPNHVLNSYEKLQHWQHYFTEINQIAYYVPFTQLAVLGICVLYFKSGDSTEKKYLRRAAIFGLAGIALTAVIVTQLNLKLYIGGQLDTYKNQLQQLSVLWLAGNALRLYLVGNALYSVLQTYLLRRIKQAALT